MKACLLRSLKKCDLIGPSMTFTLKGSSTIKTLIGGIVSLVIGLLFFIAIGYFSVDLIQRSNPLTRIANEVQDDPTIYLDKFAIPLSFSDNNGINLSFNDEFNKALNFSASFWRYDNSKEGYPFHITTYSLKECDFNEYGDHGQNFKLVLSPYLKLNCIDSTSGKDETGKHVKENLKISREFLQPGSTFLQLNIQRCDEVASPGCAKFFKTNTSFKIFIAYVRTTLNVNNFENPISSYISSLETNASLGLYTETKFDFQFNELIDDTDFFLSNASTQTWIDATSLSSYVSSYNPSDKLLLRVSVYVKGTKLVQYRQYLKIPELMANLGGFFKALITLSKAFVWIFSKFELFETIYRACSPKTQINNLVRNTTV